jgi:hypothetical protein
MSAPYFDPHTLNPETPEDKWRNPFYGKLAGLIYEYQSIGMPPELIMEVLGYAVSEFAQRKIGFWQEGK